VRMEFNILNSGSPFKQWNKGVSVARGEYIWIAESDDYADKQFLEKLVPRLDAEPDATFAYCRSWNISLDDQPKSFADPWFVRSDAQHRWTQDFCTDGVAECRNYLMRCNTVPNASAVLFRKAIYQQLGGADESLCLCGDWKVWAAMALAGKVLYLAEPLNYYRFHAATVRSAIYGTQRELRESIPVRWWILDHATRPESPISDPQVKRTLTKCCMDQAFLSYPDFPNISREALRRVEELGGTDYIPPFSSWRGELLRRIVGWRATRRANVFYHRSFSWARNAMRQERKPVELTPAE
jgi:hypothetical protein